MGSDSSTPVNSDEEDISNEDDTETFMGEPFHKWTTLDELRGRIKVGDIIGVQRGYAGLNRITHYMLYLGFEDKVIHFYAEGEREKNNEWKVLWGQMTLAEGMGDVRGVVALENIDSVISPTASCAVYNFLAELKYVNIKKRRSNAAIVREAERVFYEAIRNPLSYNLAKFNCEHFATMLRYGNNESMKKGKSRQISHYGPRWELGC